MSRARSRPKPAAQTQSRHRGLAVIFGLTTLVFAGIIVYFAFARTIVTVTPDEQPLSVVFPITIEAAAPADGSTDALQGTMATTTAAAQAELPKLTNGETVDALAQGTVTITNNWNQAQPLAATTRLLSSDGVLFRTDAFVSVPAGGTATVAVTADVAGASGNLKPSHFTIPGLWSGLQDKIYGDSSETMTGGTISRAVVTADDITSLHQKLDAELARQAQQTLTQQLTQIDATIVSDDIRFFTYHPTETLSAAAGDVADNLHGSTTATVIGVAITKSDLYTTIINKLLEQLPAGETLTGFGEDNFSLALDAYDETAKTVELNVTAHAVSTIDPDDSLFSTTTLTNKSRAEIVSALSGISVVKTVSVRFSPFWITRSPALADHIKIEVASP